MLTDKLKKYSENGIYPFHMPGHKRMTINPLLPYSIDITEIDGFDNLHCPNDCIKAIEDRASDIWGAKRAFLLVNGATSGILSAIRAMTEFGDKVLIARNCHKSVYNAVELCGLRADYIVPQYDNGYGIATSVNPDSVSQALEKNKDIKLVVLTSPTYEGIVSDVSSIASICKQYGARLFIDEAHGAHFPFCKDMPVTAISCGADAVVTSLHKTLPSLTQTALLLINDGNLEQKFRQNLSIFQTSSPSYVFISSIESCIDYASKADFEEYMKYLFAFYSKTGCMKNIKVLYNDKSFVNNCFDYDSGKIIISFRDTELTGAEAARILRKRYKIEVEMAYLDYIIAMTSVCDRESGFVRLSEALLELDALCSFDGKKQSTEYYDFILPPKHYSAFEIKKFTQEIVPIGDSIGKISAEYIWAYPPGIPILVPGEEITHNTINYFERLRSSGVSVYSSVNLLPDYLSVIVAD